MKIIFSFLCAAWLTGSLPAQGGGAHDNVTIEQTERMGQQAIQLIVREASTQPVSVKIVDARGSTVYVDTLPYGAFQRAYLVDHLTQGTYTFWVRGDTFSHLRTFRVG